MGSPTQLEALKNPYYDKEVLLESQGFASGVYFDPFLLILRSLRLKCETRSRCSETAVFEGSEDPKTVSLAALREGLFDASVEVLTCFIFDPFWGAFVLNLGSF